MGKGRAVGMESLAPKAMTTTLADRCCSHDPLCFPCSGLTPQTTDETLLAERTFVPFLLTSTVQICSRQQHFVLDYLHGCSV